MEMSKETVNAMPAGPEKDKAIKELKFHESQKNREELQRRQFALRVKSNMEDDARSQPASPL